MQRVLRLLCLHACVHVFACLTGLATLAWGQTERVQGVPKGTQGACDSFGSACNAGFPAYIRSKDGSSETVHLAAGEAYYFYTQIPPANANVGAGAGGGVAELLVSEFFGSVEVFAAVGREPSAEDHDFQLDPSSCPVWTTLYLTDLPAAGGRVNFQVRPALGQDASFFALVKGSGATLGADSGTVPLALGYPQQYIIGGAATSTFRFLPTSNTATLDIVLTSVTMGESGADNHGGINPQNTQAVFMVEGPSDSSGHRRVWNSCYNNTCSATTVDIISLTPTADELARGAFTVTAWLTEANFSKAVPFSTTPALSPAHKNSSAFVTMLASAASDTQPTQLLAQAGIPQWDYVSGNSEKFYVVHAPARGTSEVITVDTDAITGDPDIFVNPAAKGFYHRTRQNQPNYDPPPAWSSSAIGTVSDSVEMRSGDSDFLLGGGDYLVTVYGFRSSRYTLRAALENSVVTLLEGEPLTGSVQQGAYKYFRFFDSDSGKDVQFDLQISTGDADLYVSCMSKPTGTDSGYPSKHSGHSNYSSVWYQEDALWVEHDDPNSCGKHGGVFYLAVLGYGNGANHFTMLASHYGGTKTLRAGLPYTDTVFKQLGAWYQFYAGAEAEAVTVTVTSLSGDADLFVKMGETAHTYNYDYRSMMMTKVVDTITIPESKVCVNCYISILVYGYKTSDFTLMVTLEETTVKLVDTVPLQGAVRARATQFYTAIAPANSTASVVVTAFTGQPELMVSRSVEKPTVTSNRSTEITYDQGWYTGGVPSVSQGGVREGQVLYIGVTGNDLNSTYSVRVSFDARVNGVGNPPLLRLTEGLSQGDFIPYVDINTARETDWWKYYVTTVKLGHENLDIRATHLAGDVDLYVNKCPHTDVKRCYEFAPNMTYYEATTKGGYGLSDNLIATRSDDLDCSYVIGVRSNSFFAAYQISLTLDKSTLALQAGVQVIDHVAAGDLDYFSFFLDSEGESLLINVKRSNGDPDVFVSTTLSQPGPHNYTWRAVNSGSDNLMIDPTVDSGACFKCTYFIAVYGAMDSVYWVTASLGSTTPRLLDGVSVSDGVAFVAYKYYAFSNHYGAARDLKVALTTTLGNADLYVTVDGSVPSNANYQYYSRHYGTAVDSVTMRATDQKFSACVAPSGSPSGSGDPASRGCVVRVAVYGESHISEYSIVLTSSLAATELEPGVPATETVDAGAYAYYKLRAHSLASAPQQGFAVALQLNVLSGHTHVYVSCGERLGLPNATRHQWEFDPSVTPSLEIPSQAALDMGCTDGSGESGDGAGVEFFVSVLGKTTASYTITGTVEAADAVLKTLVPGVTATASVGFSKFLYYSLTVDIYDDVDISTTSTQGDVDLYISDSWANRPVYNAATRSVSRYSMRSAGLGQENLHLPHGTIKSWCAGRSAGDCYIVVGIFGAYNISSSTAANANANAFMLTASFEESTVLLTNGVPVRGHVDSREYAYYKYSVHSAGADLVLSLTPFSGDPDMFVSVSPVTRPSKTNHTWEAASFGPDTLTIQAEALQRLCRNADSVAFSCDVYVGIYGFANSTYSLLAHVDEGFLAPVVLVDGQPQTGSVPRGQYRYYKYTASAASGGPEDAVGHIASSLVFTVTPSSGSDFDMYLTFDGREPGVDSFDYESTGWGNVAEQVEVQPNMEHYCMACTINIAVRAYMEGTYTIVAASKGVETLQSGRPVYGYGHYREWKFYTFYNTAPQAVMTFALTVVTGDCDLYINKYEPHTSTNSSATVEPPKLPSLQYFNWHSTSFGSDDITIDYTDPQFCVDCSYIVGVYSYGTFAEGSNSSYSLVATEKEDKIIRLTGSQPLTLSIPETGGVKYVSTLTYSSADDVTISLTPLDNGFADMYMQVYNASEYAKLNAEAAGDAGASALRLPDPADPTTYAFTTAGSSGNTLFARGPHMKEMVFVIAIKALAPVRFTIFAKTEQEYPILLLSGVPTNQFIKAGHMEHFIYVFTEDVDVRISLTSRSGDSDLYVTSTRKDVWPSCAIEDDWRMLCSNYTWASRMLNTDQIVIMREAACAPVLFTTFVSSDCNEEMAFRPDLGVPLRIAVYGFSDSEFTLQVSPSNVMNTLLAGTPQLAVATPSILCNSRDATTGACEELDSNTQSDATAPERVLYAHFSFVVSAPSDGSAWPDPLSSSGVGDLLVTIIPDCPVNASGTLTDDAHIPWPWEAGCRPGCPCNPLRAYATSCARDECTQVDRYPSDFKGGHIANITVRSETDGSTLSVPTYGSGQCDPLLQPAGGACVYYIGIVANYQPWENPENQVASFNIVARTPYDITLAPCASKASPDRVRFVAAEESVTATHPTRFYEICSSIPTMAADGNDELLVVTVEQCAGTTTLTGCGAGGHCTEGLPTLDSWEYYADQTQSCHRKWLPSANGNAGGWGKSTCTPSDSFDGGGVHRAQLRLPSRSAGAGGPQGNYFVSGSGDGVYSLSVSTTANHGALGGPSVSPLMGPMAKTWRVSLVADDEDADPLRQLKSQAVKLRWKAAGVVLPGVSMPVESSSLRYTAYAVDVNMLAKARAAEQNAFPEPLLGTPCGLAHTQKTYPSTIITIPLGGYDRPAGVDVQDAEMHVEIGNLPPNSVLNVTIVASCDSECLYLLSKTLGPDVKGALRCDDPLTPCQPIKAVYSPVTVFTGSDAGGGGSGTSGAGSGWISRFLIVTGVAMVFVLIFILVSGYLFVKLRGGNEEGLGEYDVTAASSEHGFSLPSVNLFGQGSAPGGLRKTRVRRSIGRAEDWVDGAGSADSFDAVTGDGSDDPAMPVGYVPPAVGAGMGALIGGVSEVGRKLTSSVSQAGRRAGQVIGEMARKGKEIGIGSSGSGSGHGGGQGGGGGGAGGSSTVELQSSVSYNPLSHNTLLRGDDEDDEITVQL